MRARFHHFEQLPNCRSARQQPQWRPGRLRRRAESRRGRLRRAPPPPPPLWRRGGAPAARPPPRRPFIPTSEAFQAGFGGSQDAFVAVLNPGVGLDYLTYVGGSGTEDGKSIAL